MNRCMQCGANLSLGFGHHEGCTRRTSPFADVKIGECFRWNGTVYRKNGSRTGLRTDTQTPQQWMIPKTAVVELQPNSRVTEQAPPTPNDKPAIWDLVMEDFKARDTEGRRKYGTPLQAGNGRDALVDAYQEALDLVVYLRQEIEERRTEREKIAAWVEDQGAPFSELTDEIRNGDYEK